MSDTTSKEIIELVDHLFKNGYNPNFIKLGFEELTYTPRESNK